MSKHESKKSVYTRYAVGILLEVGLTLALFGACLLIILLLAGGSVR